jgi:hypothetical protein
VSDDNFISRWSKRKHAAKRTDVAPAPASVAPAPANVVPVPSDVVPAQAGTQPPAEAKPLPPIESLTPESDFTPFMGGQVDPALRRAALKTLFRDPRFNVMDGLDVYIDDYSKPDPLPEGWLEKLNQVARLGDYRPPAPPEELTGAAAEGQKDEAEQPLVGAPAEPSADTSETGSPPPQSKES